MYRFPEWAARVSKSQTQVNDCLIHSRAQSPQVCGVLHYLSPHFRFSNKHLLYCLQRDTRFSVYTFLFYFFFLLHISLNLSQLLVTYHRVIKWLKKRKIEFTNNHFLADKYWLLIASKFTIYIE